MSEDPSLVLRQRVLRAADHIVANIDHPLTVAEVAKVAAMSESHFHRVFAAAMNETVGEFIVRRRAELAALMLAYQRERSIGDIALSVGYSSSANFAKAFHAYFGCPPSAVRKANSATQSRVGKLLSRYGKAFAPRDLYALPELAPYAERERRARELARDVRFGHKPKIALAGLPSRAGYDFDHLTSLWEELIARARQLGLCEEDVDAYGLAHDSPRITASALLRYDACVPYDGRTRLPSPLVSRTIPEGRYAIFRYAGVVSGLEARIREIYSLWFPFSSVTPDDLSMTIDHYINDAPVDGEVDMEIWIKVRPKTY